MKSNNRIVAIILSVVVGLAELVIIHEIWLSGTWLTVSDSWLGSFLSAAKTAAFVLLFIGGLIAETQAISNKTRAWLTVSVIILGMYQLAVNIAINFYHANIPAEAQEIFAGQLSEWQIRLLWSALDATTRFLVVVIMWIVTGQVWRGIATGLDNAKDEVSKWRNSTYELQAANKRLQADVEKLQQENIGNAAWDKMPATWRAAIGRLAEQCMENGNKKEFVEAVRDEVNAPTWSRAGKDI